MVGAIFGCGPCNLCLGLGVDTGHVLWPDVSQIN
jgi:hypothetical protein